MEELECWRGGGGREEEEGDGGGGASAGGGGPLRRLEGGGTRGEEEGGDGDGPVGDGPVQPTEPSEVTSTTPLLTSLFTNFFACLFEDLPSAPSGNLGERCSKRSERGREDVRRRETEESSIGWEGGCVEEGCMV